MAHRRSIVPTIILEDIQELVTVIRDNILPHAVDPTQFIVPSTDGSVDPFTEEVTYGTESTFFNVSGIVGRVQEEDMLFGMNGQIKVGDVKVTYAYDSVSGIVGFENIEQIKILSPSVSGVYFINGRTFDVMGNVPIFVDFALGVDRNG